MEGLERFREAFEAYSDNYVIIGGTACEMVMSGTASIGKVSIEYMPAANSNIVINATINFFRTENLTIFSNIF